MVLLEATGTILIDSIPSMFSFEDEDDDTLDDWEAMMEAQKTCMCLYMNSLFGLKCAYSSINRPQYYAVIEIDKDTDRQSTVSHR